MFCHAAVIHSALLRQAAGPGEEAEEADAASEGQESGFIVESEATYESESSLMQIVWARQTAQGNQASQASPMSLPVSTGPVSVVQTGTSKTPVASSLQPPRPRSRCLPTIRMAIAMPLVLTSLIAFAVKYLVMVREHDRMMRSFSEVFDSTRTAQLDLSRGLLQKKQGLHHSIVLRKLDEQVSQYSLHLPDRAVKGLWNSMQTLKHFGATAAAETEEERWRLAYSMWSEIGSRNQQRLELINRADALLVAFDSGSFTAVVSSVLVGEDDETSGLWYEQGSNTSLMEWRMALDAQAPAAPPRQVAPSISVISQPFYKVQAHMAVERPEGEAVQAWSGIHDLSFKESPAMMSWTYPISYCGAYSCMEGVVAASITISSVNRWCTAAWLELANKLREKPYNFTLDPTNSAVFIVNQASVLPGQEGIVVGQSLQNDGEVLEHVQLRDLRKAADSERSIVRATTGALLQKYASWGNETLSREGDPDRDPDPFAYCVAEDGSGDTQILGPSEYKPFRRPGCWEVATHSVRLDNRTRWLLVLAIPLGAFSGDVEKTDLEINQTVEDEWEDLEATMREVSVFNLTNSIITLVCSFLVGMFISICVSHDLMSLRVQMQKLTTLDLDLESKDFRLLLAGKRAVISDVSQLQDAFARLARVLQAFGRFVPAPVVRNIVRGNERANRLHVSKREVTIMVSDVQGFTSIAEELAQSDLLYVLTRYLTVMTEIVERSEGVVTEILGDGMLAFWNTPDDVANHATKACLAALEQQEALKDLNEEFAAEGLPKLAIRIGLHTGKVLSGNLGSESKMKFGCMGDAVNLASRLEELCKEYCTGILCSGATRSKLRGIACRELGAISVSGRAEPMPVCRVVGRSSTFS